MFRSGSAVEPDIERDIHARGNGRVAVYQAGAIDTGSVLASPFMHE
jgi:hypothetical protein